MSLAKVIGCLKKYKKFLITAHANIDGDALGAELAFYRMLKKMGKDALIINEDDIPYGYDFLPQLKVIKSFRKNLGSIKFDCFVALDCSDLKRTGRVYTVNQENKPVLNIDHHISNVKFGQVNWVEPEAACTCEMLYELFKKLRLSLDDKTALCLYAGILTDTGSFRYSNTSVLTHQIAAQLLRHKIDVARVYKNVYGNIPFADLKLLTAILPTMKREVNGKLVWFEIHKNIFKKQKNISFDLSESVLNFARSMKDVEVVVLFKESIGLKNEIRVNFRSQDKIDVNRIADFFGGGGHKTASGLTIKGSLKEVERRVLRKVRQALEALHESYR